MSLQIPPDPYVALGVPKTADLATIKSTYRKLVLKCHPDKFPDQAVKAQKQEEFQKIQQAYELVGDEDARSRYDSLVRLEELRKEGLEKQRKGAAEGVRSETRGPYNVRTAEPAGFGRTTTSEAKHRPSYDESDRFYEEQRTSSRKYEGYEPPSRRSPRIDREDKSRGDKKKTRDRDERRERTTKYSYVDDDDSDERMRFEKTYRRRNEEERAREERVREDRAREDRYREELKRRAEEARRDEERRDAEDKARRRVDYNDDYEKKTRDARDYIERSRVSSHDERPSMPRVNSSSSTHFIRRSSDKPVEVRRSRASKERRSSRERKYEIVEPSAEWTKPSLEKSHSTPANIKIPRVSPQRSRSHIQEQSPPRLNRADTEPLRRKDATPAQPSKLRDSTVAQDSGYSSPTSPETSSYPAAQSPPKSASRTKTYQYTAVPGGVATTLPYVPEEYDYSGGHRTVLREPGRYRARSPESMSREAQHERVHPTSRSTPVTSGVRYTAAVRPPIPHANSSARVEDLREAREERERGRDRSDRPLYGETTHAAYRRGEKASSGGLYNPENVHYSRRYEKDDVQWSSAFKAGYEAAMKEKYAGSRGYDEERPKLGSRSATTVY